jgi:rare lipoprotein A
MAAWCFAFVLLLDQVAEIRTGLASFFSVGEGTPTASGEVYDKEEMVAAHPTYPAGTIVRVTNLENGRSVKVRIIDRGPTRENRAEGVIIDLSRGAAVRLRMLKDGRVKVRTEVLKWGGKPMKRSTR